jgi:hypothetical protein
LFTFLWPIFNLIEIGINLGDINNTNQFENYTSSIWRVLFTKFYSARTMRDIPFSDVLFKTYNSARNM